MYNCPKEILLDVISYTSNKSYHNTRNLYSIARFAAAHKNTPTPILHKLYTHENYIIRYKISKNKNTSSDTLYSLLKFELRNYNINSPLIFMGIVKNNNTTEQILKKLISICESVESNDLVLAEARKRCYFKNMTKHPKCNATRYAVMLKAFEIEDVLPFTTNRKYKKEYVVDGKSYKVNMKSHRYDTFKKSLSCVRCGITGSKFILERPTHHDHFHFNLYAQDNSGLWILMTKDHIVPRSKGGKDKLENYQTMCEICNTEKADK